MNMREDIVRAKGVLKQPMPPVTELHVNCSALEDVDID